MLNREPILFVISAPSGAGKTSLWKEILKKVENITISVSATTRPPRKGEVDGKDYIFISEKNFKDMLEKNEFLEWAEVHGYLYGTPLKNIEDAKKLNSDVILEIDVQGAKKIKEKGKVDAVYIFILPPSYDELKKRLLKRGDLPQTEIERRLKNALKELEMGEFYDYLIINDNFEKACDELRAIIISERNRMKRNRGKLKSLKNML